MLEALQTIAEFWSKVWDIAMNLASFVLSALWFIWYAFKSLLFWIWTLLERVFDWWVFIHITEAFIKISDYIWAPATYFLSAMLFIAIFRVIASFIIKLLKWDIIYNIHKSWQRHNREPTDYVEDETYPRLTHR